ncbi:putative uncharacterized protein C3orf49 [Amia ocellicauda]|uniref:putative uncharacterized protein C3orf49 n=1 Tax=Amia ocellicauda TaxID=2972642 RepID=UPI0034649DF7
MQQNQMRHSPLVCVCKDKKYGTVSGKDSSLKGRTTGLTRWHGTVSTNLNRGIDGTQNEACNETVHMDNSETAAHKPRGFGNKLKKTLGRLLSPCHQSHHEAHGKIKTGKGITYAKRSKNLICSGKQMFLRKSLPSPKMCPEISKRRPQVSYCLDIHDRREVNQKTSEMTPFCKIEENDMIKSFNPATIQVDVVEAETEKFIGNNVVLRSRRMLRRVSVTSLTAQHQKAPNFKKRRYFGVFKKRRRRKPVEKSRRQSTSTVGKLQTEVDDLIETMAGQSMKLLAQRRAELERCECLGDEVLQSSKQFQRVSRKNTRKYKWKNMCILCTCCC